MPNYYDNFYSYGTQLTAFAEGVHREHVAEYQQLVWLAITGAKQEIKDEVLREVE